ncbi:hypothetical protein AOL_s00188g329 [Orbilia oligospora ATCC 24927]|uniref:Uncharacterized protein n=1 Tax=Arthrobotrys oligospora (strain ATCC 24927 / CBS 115.81 / DSM 1491) TaxID=756982 RepID=G1XQW7_ARTOA|nr:hypothetical protein AOL_s00188g329 [Orbilia oligospora ATCC 24927]EGX44661.1 hypothetical protein AOL_s00188g329 [Orbilia oligospora ATCC 24927]
MASSTASTSPTTTTPATLTPPSGYAIKTFQIPVSPTSSTSTISIKITEPNLTAQNLPLETWASSHILASLLRQIKINFPSSSNNKDVDVLPILELGAGTGLVGISAGAIWQKPVILTDLEPIIPGIQLNVDINNVGSQLDAINNNISSPDHSTLDTTTAATNPESIRCGTLDWKSPTILSMYTDKRMYFSTNTKAHVILAADTVYSEEHPGLLSDVIKNWLYKDQEARVVIAYPMRVAYLEEIRELWDKFEEIGLEAVDEGKETANGELFDDELLIEWSLWRWRSEVLEV